jgi:hypothetical protein
MKLTKAQAVLFWVGMLFIVSGLFHVGVWLWHGAPSLIGPVTWRKPIVFGLSTGVVSLSLAWVVGLLPQTARLVRQAWFYAVLMVAEIALIDIQQWRGVASHFNQSTALDGAIFTAMGVLITTIAVLIALWTRALFRPLPTTPGYAFAARTGMVLLNIGNLIGMTIAATGATGLKPIHGVALHAIQALPIAVWLAARRPLSYSRAWRNVR